VVFGSNPLPLVATKTRSKSYANATPSKHATISFQALTEAIGRRAENVNHSLGYFLDTALGGFSAFLPPSL